MSKPVALILAIGLIFLGLWMIALGAGLTGDHTPPLPPPGLSSSAAQAPPVPSLNPAALGVPLLAGGVILSLLALRR